MILLLTYLGLSLLVVAIGLCLRRLTLRRLAFAPTPSESVILSTGLAGYLGFWSYALSPVIGGVLTVVLLALPCAVATVPAWRAGIRADLRLFRPLLWPFGLGALLVLLFVSWGEAVGGTEANRFFFNDLRPNDNFLPRGFARDLLSWDRSKLSGLDPAGWRNADRPPLQSGILLALGGPLLADRFSPYLGAGILCQILAALSLVTLRERGLLSKRAFHLSLALYALTGLIFFYTVYVWPKLLAAGFVICAVAAMHRLVVGDRPGRGDHWTLALSAGFAMLSHGAAVFSLLAFGLVYGLLAVRRGRLKALMAGVLLALTLYAPWIGYQKLVDPPGDRLLKMHLAGIHHVDEEIGAAEAIADAYGRLDLAQIVEWKALNFQSLLGNPSLDRAQVLVWRGLLGGECEPAAISQALIPVDFLLERETVGCSLSDALMLHRLDQREHLARALAIPLLLTLVAAGFALKRRNDAETGFARVLLAAQAATVLIWCLLLFGPAQAVITHASLALVVLTLVTAAIGAVRLPDPVAWGAAAVMAADFTLTWIWPLPQCEAPSCVLQADSGSPVLTVLAYLGLAGFVLANLALATHAAAAGRPTPAIRTGRPRTAPAGPAGPRSGPNR